MDTKCPLWTILLSEADMHKEDYIEQSKLLTKKLIEKGYDVTHIETAFNKYLAQYDNHQDHNKK